MEYTSEDLELEVRKHGAHTKMRNQKGELIKIIRKRDNMKEEVLSIAITKKKDTVSRKNRGGRGNG